MLQHQPQASSNPATALSEARTGAATVLSCGHSAPHNAEEDVQSYGANSPRAARSQISTAVSFEGAKPAGSAALASRSAEGDSAHSVAEPEGENSSMPPVQPQGHHQFLDQPTTSLLSTAVRATSPPLGQPGSPDLYRANSVVSHTETQQARAARAGTPASVYAQGRVRPPARSPEASQAGEQHSGSEGARRSARSSRRPQTGRGSRISEIQTSRPASFLAPGSRKRQQPEPPRQHSPAAENNSIEAVERGSSQDGQGGLASAEGPLNHERVLPRRQDSSQAVQDGPAQQQPGGQAQLQAQAPSLMQASKDARPGQTDRQGDGNAWLHHQSSAVLGSGLLTFLLPNQQQLPLGPHGLQTRRSLNAPSVVSAVPTLQRPVASHQPPPPQPPQPLSGLEAGRVEKTRELLAANEAHSLPHPQPAMHQELDEAPGPASDAEMTGPPAAGPSEEAAREASPSRLAGVSLNPGGAATFSGGSHHRPSSGNLAGASADAQALGSVLWGEPQGASLSDQEAAQPATSVLGTLVAEDVASDMEHDTDVRSIRPAAAEANALPTGSADGAPAFAVATANVAAQQNKLPSLPRSQLAHSARRQEGGAQLEGQASVALCKPESIQRADSQLANGSASLPAAAAAALLGLPSLSASGLPLGTALLETQLPPLTGLGQAEDGAGSGLPPLPPSNSERAHSRRTGPPLSARLSQGGAVEDSPRSGGGPGDSHASAHQLRLDASGEDPAGNSACCPASATVRSEGEAAVGGGETVVQSQPQAQGGVAPQGPQPALTIVMQGGLLGPSNEPDDGAAGPLGSDGKQLSANGRGSEHSSANGRATSGVTSPTRTPGRPRREAAKRKRSGAASGNA